MLSKLITSFVLISSVFSQQPNCSNNVRKEIRELTSAEFKLYVEAVKSLQKRQIGGLTIWESFTKRHADGARADKEIHGTSSFLPWHRWFIKQYEIELQKYNPSVTLPYWDWTIDARAPHKSSVLSDKLMGGNGKLFSGFAVTDGAFKNTEFNYPKKTKLSRSYNRGSVISQFATTNEVVAIMNSEKFSKFCKDFETVHGDIHVNIGGRFDFGQMTSPNDPLFYLHHTFMDMVYSKWQAKFPNSEFEGEAYNLSLHPDEKLYGYNRTVESVWDINDKDLCYSYPSYPRAIKATDGGGETVQGDSLFDVFKNLDLAQVSSQLQGFNPLDTSSGSGLLGNIQLFRPDRLLPTEGVNEQWLLANNLNVADAKKLLESRNQIRAFVDSLTLIKH